jgi:zinc transporter ZupT
MSGNSLLFGIIFHQIPVSIALMTSLIISKIKKTTIWLLMILFAITTPLGLIVGLIISDSLILSFNFDIILAIVVGMFLHISTTIIFETTENHKFNFVKLISILIGFTVIFLIN